LIAFAARYGDFAQPGHARIFVALMFGAGACFIAGAALLRRVELPRVTVIFWSVAVIARIAMLPCTPGDDLWRYIWEGPGAERGSESLPARASR
jgi:hypothetical protein